MRPPKGFGTEKFPLRHRLEHAFGLNMGNDTLNTAFLPLVRSSSDAPIDPTTIFVNPHNSSFDKETGPYCQQMSIIDRMTISIKFSMTKYCNITHESAAGVFQGDDVPVMKFLWRPIFNVYPEKMDAVDDFTTTDVKAILAMTKDPTFEDIVPITTTKLVIDSASIDRDLPLSTVNHAEVIGDYNYSASATMEDHVFDENLLQTALREYTNKGALRSCLGRTRHVTLTRNRPFHNVYIDKFVPRAIRRIQPYAMMGIQVHLPLDTEMSQPFLSDLVGIADNHLGVKMITNYHEWNSDFNDDRGTPT